MPAFQLWTGRTVHHRYVPFERQFQYDIVLIDLDIGRLDEAAAATPLFGINRPALFSFRPEDHGPKMKGASLRDWADAMFLSAGIELRDGTVRLVTFPRHLFYKFAPLSLWYGYGADGLLCGIIYEVNNTFGERHCYVAATGADRSQHEAEKSFHVSPFMEVSGRYRFTLQAPDDRLRVTIENLGSNGRTHTANIIARQHAATSANLLRIALMQPFSSIGVTIGIHWQAFRIWLRGANYQRKPQPPGRQATIASPLSREASRRSGEIA